jgi:hypothetical protein
MTKWDVFNPQYLYGSSAVRNKIWSWMSLTSKSRNMFTTLLICALLTTGPQIYILCIRGLAYNISPLSSVQCKVTQLTDALKYFVGSHFLLLFRDYYFYIPIMYRLTLVWSWHTKFNNAGTTDSQTCRRCCDWMQNLTVFLSNLKTSLSWPALKTHTDKTTQKLFTVTP